MSCRRVTVFGGTGFLGRRIVRHLQDADFAVRIASRHPDRGRSLFSRDVSGIEPFRADVNDDGSVAGKRLRITGLKHFSDSTSSRRIVDDNEPPRLA